MPGRGGARYGRRMPSNEGPTFSPGFFDRQDPGPDAAFYVAPRMVTHIDAATIAALTAWYAEVLPPGADVLDLMSSWVSHLPSADSHPLDRVAGLGMNAEELAANPRLTDWSVHDLNLTPTLAYEASSFDAVLCAVSIQYLTRPIEVFSEVARVLRPGGRVAIASSHRCFPTKAIRGFQLLPPAERIRAIGVFLREAGGFGPEEVIDRSPRNADPLWIVTAVRSPVSEA